MGCVIIHKDGWKLVYSGDTRPCESLIAAGQGCTLLIHEATFEDNLIAHAQAKKHSTMTEALTVGKRMGAQHVVLTHFSQRLGYSLPTLDHVSYPNTIIAYDHMRLRFSDLPTAAKLYTPLQMMLTEALTETVHATANPFTEGGHAATASGIGNVFRKKAVNKVEGNGGGGGGGGGGGTSSKALHKAQRRAITAAKSERKAKAEAKWKEKKKISGAGVGEKDGLTIDKNGDNSPIPTRSE